MFGLGIHYLNGWAMAAADGARKEIAEWPPHPDRVFMALAAAWFETGKDKAEGDALSWLEELAPPEIAASEAFQRHAIKEKRSPVSYVPINDSKLAGGRKIHDVLNHQNPSLKELKDAGITQLPELRPRQPRSFPVAIPVEPTVYFIWQSDIEEKLKESLASLCNKVVSVGHSASLVQMWLTTNPPEPTLVPSDGLVKHRLRVSGNGRLAYLEARMNKEAIIAYTALETQVSKATGKEKTNLKKELSIRFPQGCPMSLHPEPSLWQGYGNPATPSIEPIRGSVFAPRIIVLALSGKQLGLNSTLKITEALRGSLLTACQLPIPEWVSGHTPDGKRSEKPHIAMLPLPFVGRQHADGRLMGLALAIPREIDSIAVEKTLIPWLRDEHGLPRQIRLFDGQWFECTCEMERRDTPPMNLQSETWTTPAMCWATVTPIVLDKHFDGKDKWDKAAESIKDSCERIGLPRPVEVMLSPVSMFEGAPRSNEFPWISRKRDGGRMHHTHVVIVFLEKVQGPIIIGAGRYRGYGLLRPIQQGGKK